MNLNIVKNLVSASKYSIKCPFTMKPSRIVVHNTANDAPAKNEVAYMIKNKNQKSFHYAVDDKEVYQGIEENRNAWHCGDGNGKGNREGIAIEICYSKSGGARFNQAEQNAVELIVGILKRYNWGIDKVTKHQDYSGKYCPHRTLDLGWSRFIKMIKEKLNEKPPVKSKGYITGNYKTLYVMKVRAGAGTNYRTKKRSELSADGRKNANVLGQYKKGTIFTALEIIENGSEVWARGYSGYVCIKDNKYTYCQKV